MVHFIIYLIIIFQCCYQINIIREFVHKKVSRFGLKSDSVMENEDGPIVEPCTTLALMLATSDISSFNLVVWVRFSKYDTSQLYIAYTAVPSFRHWPNCIPRSKNAWHRQFPGQILCLWHLLDSACLEISYNTGRTGWCLWVGTGQQRIIFHKMYPQAMRWLFVAHV